ncbi:PREDICTED: bifunctional epoxide hydrolase 2-like [Camelina sativa]|uniref:Bifunctional epoxide hydrolase 2-like n=1 Tax=Camelina sativa TaxID=90675 RepID=A0ABM0TPV7_CAMSA|nr:PREDICTED: bifunctional epoxide hydrolase 2-like [Camelina sativa]
MEGIDHRMVSVNGITMHIAENGPKDGPLVLLLHGFPDFWYTWRHQISALSSLDYRTVAPDLRGYGDSDSPESFSEYTCLNVVGDLIALLDSVAGDQEKVFLVGHDWGAIIGWFLCLFRPEKIKGFVCLSVPYIPRNPSVKPVQWFRAVFGDDYYVCRFQEPGKIDGQFARADLRSLLRNIFTGRPLGPSILPKNNPFGENPNPTCENIEFPTWFSKKDLDFYASKFDKTRFTGGLNYYRAIDLSWELTAPWTGAKIQVPMKFMTGDFDMVYTTPGIKEYIHGGGFAAAVPNLQEIVVTEDAGHFVNQEKHQEVTAHINDFFTKLQNKNQSF